MLTGLEGVYPAENQSIGKRVAEDTFSQKVETITGRVWMNEMSTFNVLGAISTFRATLPDIIGLWWNDTETLLSKK